MITFGCICLRTWTWIFMIIFGTSSVCQVWHVALCLPTGRWKFAFEQDIFLLYFIWNTETFKNRDPLTIYMYCTVSDTFSIFKSDIPSYGRPKNFTIFSNIQQSFNFDFLEENVFAFLTFSLSRFTCTIVCLWDGKGSIRWGNRFGRNVLLS